MTNEVKIEPAHSFWLYSRERRQTDTLYVSVAEPKFECSEKYHVVKKSKLDEAHKRIEFLEKDAAFCRNHYDGMKTLAESLSTKNTQASDLLDKALSHLTDFISERQDGGWSYEPITNLINEIEKFRGKYEK